MIDIGLYITYLFFFIAIAAAVVFPLMQAAKHPKDLGKSAVGIGILVVIFVISYSISGSELSAKAVALGVGEGSSKLIGAGLTMFYVVLIVSLLGMVYSEISKAIK